MDQFKDKVAIITGGASGIGRALSQTLCQSGARVVVADSNGEGAQNVASGLNQAGGRAEGVALDVSRAEDVQKLIAETVAKHERLDYMFNNAGITIAGEVRDMDLDHWQRVIEVNLRGVIYGSTTAYTVMVEQGFGHIVNIASLAGLIGYPINTPYATTKYAVVGLSTSLRAEGEELGVKVSVVCPGYVQSNIYYATPVLQADIPDPLAAIPFKPMDTAKAAQIILRGVARNHRFIVFPFYARLLWWLYRLHPALLAPLDRQTVTEFRAIRRDE